MDGKLYFREGRSVRRVDVFNNFAQSSGNRYRYSSLDGWRVSPFLMIGMVFYIRQSCGMVPVDNDCEQTGDKTVQTHV